MENTDTQTTTEERDFSGYLKWDNDIIGYIDRDKNAVVFTQPEYNRVVALYTRGQLHWNAEQFTESRL